MRTHTAADGDPDLVVAWGNPSMGLACGGVVKTTPPAIVGADYITALRSVLAIVSFSEEDAKASAKKLGLGWRDDYYWRMTEDYDDGQRLKRLFEFRWEDPDASGVFTGLMFWDLSEERAIHVICSTLNDEINASYLSYLLSSHLNSMPPESDSASSAPQPSRPLTTPPIAWPEGISHDRRLRKNCRIRSDDDLRSVGYLQKSLTRTLLISIFVVSVVMFILMG